MKGARIPGLALAVVPDSHPVHLRGFSELITRVAWVTEKRPSGSPSGATAEPDERADRRCWPCRFYSDGNEGRPERRLVELLARFQSAGRLRPDFEPTVMAVSIRAPIIAVPPRLVSDSDLDVDSHATEIASTSTCILHGGILAISVRRRTMTDAALRPVLVVGRGPSDASGDGDGRASEVPPNAYEPTARGRASGRRAVIATMSSVSGSRGRRRLQTPDRGVGQCRAKPLPWQAVPGGG
jgi:hypothetical protein